jgi:hypothetical protein
MEYYIPKLWCCYDLPLQHDHFMLNTTCKTSLWLDNTTHRPKIHCFSLKITEHHKITETCNLIHLWNNEIVIWTDKLFTQSWVFLGKLIGDQVAKKFLAPGLLWKLKIRYNITRAHHWNRLNPVPTLQLYSKIPPSYLYLGLSRGSLTKILYAFLRPSI